MELDAMRSSGAAIHVLVRACNAMMNRRLDRVLQPHALSAAGYLTMIALRDRENNLASPSELSDDTGESRAHMTRICDDLVRHGWIRREWNPADRRRVDLSLTTDGQRLLDRLEATHRDQVQGVHERVLDRPDRALLQDLLTRLSQELSGDP